MKNSILKLMLIKGVVILVLLLVIAGYTFYKLSSLKKWSETIDNIAKARP